jgi:hypothetical protein
LGLVKAFNIPANELEISDSAKANNIAGERLERIANIKNKYLYLLKYLL